MAHPSLRLHLALALLADHPMSGPELANLLWWVDAQCWVEIGEGIDFRPWMLRDDGPSLEGTDAWYAGLADPAWSAYVHTMADGRLTATPQGWALPLDALTKRHFRILHTGLAAGPAHIAADRAQVDQVFTALGVARPHLAHPEETLRASGWPEAAIPEAAAHYRERQAMASRRD